MDEQHSQAWELIKQRQAYLDDLTAQANRIRAELADLNKQVTNKHKIVANYEAEAQQRFLSSNPKLLASKSQLSAEQWALKQQNETLQSTLDTGWAEHDALVKMISHINKEAVALSEESRIESVRLVNEINGLKTEIASLQETKIEIVSEFHEVAKDLRDSKADIERARDRLEDIKVSYDTMELHYKEKMVQNKKQLEATYLRLNQATSQLQDISSKDTQMRTDIANERMRLEQARVKSGRGKVNPNLLEL